MRSAVFQLQNPLVSTFPHHSTTSGWFEGPDFLKPTVFSSTNITFGQKGSAQSIGTTNKSPQRRSLQLLRFCLSAFLIQREHRCAVQTPRCLQELNILMTLEGRPAYHYRMCVGVSSKAASQNNQKNTTLRTSSFGESSSLPLKCVAQKTTVLPSISFVSFAKLVEALTSKHIGSNQILSSLQILRVQPTQKNWQPRFVKKSSSPRRSLPRKNHGMMWSLSCINPYVSHPTK